MITGRYRLLVAVVWTSLAVGACTGTNAGGDSPDPGGWVLESDAVEEVGDRDTGSRPRDTAPPPLDTFTPDPVDTSTGEDTGVTDEDTYVAEEDTSVTVRDTRDGREEDVCRYPESVPVRGILRLHPLTRWEEPGAEVQGLSLWLIEAVPYASGQRRVLEARDCGPARVDFTAHMREGMYFFEEVDVSGITEAMLASVDDSPNVNRDVLIPTVTGVAEEHKLSSAVTAYTSWAVSREVEAKLADLAGMNAGDLVRQGFIIGTVERNGGGVAGLNVAEEGTGTPLDRAIYPNEDLSGTRMSTASHGVFIIPNAGLGQYVMVDGGGDTVSTVERGLSVGGSAFAMVFDYTGN